MQKLGILGGGQLARMLALAAHPLGIEVHILSERNSDPAAQVVRYYHQGSINDSAAIAAFAKSVDHLTFESEFVDVGLLRKSLPAKVKVYPNLISVETIQDRKTQKELLDQYKIKTSPWLEVNSPEQFANAHEKFRHFVLKKRRFGYDGYGTFVLKNKVDLALLAQAEHGFIAEKFVSFKRELAITFVRGQDGKFLSLPLVESVQKNSRCFSVVGPVKHSGLKKLSAQFRKLMDELDYVGVLAVELFATDDGLIVNELAPRVHNSAHYSIEALSCSQFAYHLRSGLQLPLPKIELLRSGFAMVNLLGEKAKEAKLSFSDIGHLHWYGKQELRPGRKMGHITVLNPSGKKALALATSWQKEFVL